MRSIRIQRLCQSALFAAVIFVFTAYLHVPSFNGYTHVGDGFLYLAASTLPLGYAAAAGAIGAGLADVMSGYAMWAPATLVIKAATACFFTSQAPTFLCRRNYLALLPSLLLCAGGYYLYESVLTGNFIAPAAGITGYLTQVVLSSVLYLLLGRAMDRANLKQRLVYSPKVG
jgi:uncharacterized repeat protein (TIGR04002 family)